MAWSRASAALWRSVPGYLALAKPDGTLTEVRGPGADVWQEIERPAELDQIVESLALRYLADRSVVLQDVRRLLVELEKGGYVSHDG